MNTQKAILLAGGVRQLAELLGLTTQAVYKWGETMPELQAFRLKELRPNWFETKGGRRG